MIFIFLTTLLFAQDYCQNKSWVDPQYSQLEASINKKIEQSSHLVTIASEADMVLSKLIKAKSPVLMSWLEKRNLLKENEEKIAQEWRKYYLENFILSKYPTPNHKINNSVENLFKEVNELAFNDDFKKRLEKLFKQAQADTIGKIESWDLEDKTKNEIKDRISSMKLYWFEKLKGSKYQNIPLEFIKWGIAYDPMPNEINIGVQAKKYANDSTIYSVMVHEIGHSFDPCRWSAFYKSENPFNKLYDCLRSSKSIGAKSRDDSMMDTMVEKNYLSKEMVESLKQNPTCNRSFYPPTGTQKEQLLEVFADWLSAEVISTSEHLDKNLRTDLCESKKITNGSSYLPHRDRLEKVYFAQPEIQKKLKVKSTADYCALEFDKN